MIQKLQKRLTFLCGLLTSLILLVTLAAAWHFSAEQYEANQKALFGTSFHFISDHIASGSVLRDSWLKQQETTNQCIIYIEDGTIPLYYSGDGVLTDLRECLINAAKDRTQKKKQSSVVFTGVMKAERINPIWVSVSLSPKKLLTHTMHPLK